MNIGDRVVSKKTGFPGVGVVCGIVSSELFSIVSPVKKFILWDKLYSDWGEKEIIYVKFEELRKNLTFEEYRETFLEIPERDLEVLYAYTVSKTKILSYPVDDLELEA